MKGPSTKPKFRDIPSNAPSRSNVACIILVLGCVVILWVLWSMDDIHQPSEKHSVAVVHDVPSFRNSSTDSQNILFRDPTRLEIVIKAAPVDLAYVAAGSASHPHMGARNAMGQWGYVHDETHIRRNPPALHFPHLVSECAKRDANHKMLTKKVTVAEPTTNGIRLMCIVYSTDLEPQRDQLQSIIQTWGRKCDGFMVGSNKTDPSVGAVDIPHEGIEAYNNMYQKVRSIWSYVYDNYYEKYDWFHIGGDDMYLIVENLRWYLGSEEIRLAAKHNVVTKDNLERPMFLGRRFAYMGDMNEIFNSGGSGYTLNKAALKTLVVDGFPRLFPHAKTFSEDTMVARILRKFGVFPYETKDETGAERYMPFMPGHHLTYRMPLVTSSDWYAKYSINIKFGLDHCASKSVAFHYVKRDAMKRFDAILFKLCPSEQ